MDHSSISFEITLLRPIEDIKSVDKPIFFGFTPQCTMSQSICKEPNHLFLSTHSHLFKDAL